jgi:phage terminase large subunit
LAAKRLAERRAAKTLPFDEYRDEPVRFAREILGLSLWSRQREIIEKVANHTRVAVRSGHKIGKSSSAVALALWFVCTRPRARVVMTSSTDRQVRMILWKELRRIYGPVKERIGGVCNLDPATGLQFTDGREIVGFSTKDPEKMAGISGPAILFIVDEASGVPEEIFEAIEGNRAGGARFAMFSNPTQTSGTFFDAFNTKSEFWTCIHVSSEETPNCTGEEDSIPGLATREWVDEKIQEWGRASPLFDIRVAGNFPTQGENAVTPLALVEAAVDRWEDTSPDGRLEIGVDVARFGDDDSVICYRRGLRVEPLIVIHGMDTVAVAGRVMGLVREKRAKNERPRVKVDTIGVGGGVADNLRQFHNKDIDLIEVNSSEKSSAPDDFYNLRSQLSFAVTKWLEDGGALPDDGKLRGELVAPTYSFDPRGRRKVESKDEIKKRMNRSPDRADALALAVYAKNLGASGKLATIATHDYENQSIF